MIYGLAALAFVVFVGAVLGQLARIRLRDEIGAAESRLSRRIYLLQGRLSELSVTVQRMEFERRNERGEIGFESSMNVGDALAVHPRVQEVFAAFGLSGSGCSPGGGADETHTLADACRNASVDTGSLLLALERFLKDPTGPVRTGGATAKLYRIGSLPPSRN